MSTLILYTFEGDDGKQDWNTMDYEEAREYASKYGYKIIANTYEWTDSELVEDCEESDACDLCGQPGCTVCITYVIVD
jgi:hypothetical protein